MRIHIVLKDGAGLSSMLPHRCEKLLIRVSNINLVTRRLRAIKLIHDAILLQVLRTSMGAELRRKFQRLIICDQVD